MQMLPIEQQWKFKVFPIFTEELYGILMPYGYFKLVVNSARIIL